LPPVLDGSFNRAEVLQWWQGSQSSVSVVPNAGEDVEADVAGVTNERFGSVPVGEVVSELPRF
jgi:hypothetical protein